MKWCIYKDYDLSLNIGILVHTCTITRHKAGNGAYERHKATTVYGTQYMTTTWPEQAIRAQGCFHRCSLAASGQYLEHASANICSLLDLTCPL